jgi:hypothetical protein
MARHSVLLGIVLCVAAAFTVATAGDAASKAPGDWSMNATIIEACSCPMFCQCYFNPKPHTGAPGCCSDEDGAFCRFNNVFRVNKGGYGAVSLDGIKFWIAGDLGGDFSKAPSLDGHDWAMIHFEKSATKEQRDGVLAIVSHIYPVKWSKLGVGADGMIDWSFDKDRAQALLDGGKGGEVRLKRCAGNTDDPVVIHNLKYWNTPRNEGFVLMTNEVEAYRLGEKSFEFKGTNGFMITIDIGSKDMAAAKPATGGGY